MSPQSKSGGGGGVHTGGYDGSPPARPPPPPPPVFFGGFALTVTERVVALARPAEFDAVTRHASRLPASLLASLRRLRCVFVAMPFLSQVYLKPWGDQRQRPCVQAMVD